jgi:thioredoxin reductase (NADPH)
MRNPKIEVLWETEALEAVGDRFLTGVRVIDKRAGAERVIEASGLFYAIGHRPNTDFLAGQLEMDDDGYLVTEPGSTRTSKLGVFAAGDVQDKVYRQAVTAAGSGCMAALEAERLLAEEE